MRPSVYLTAIARSHKNNLLAHLKNLLLSWQLLRYSVEFPTLSECRMFPAVTLLPLALSFILVAGFLKLAAFINKRAVVKWSHTFIFAGMLCMLSTVRIVIQTHLGATIPPGIGLMLGCLIVIFLGGWYFKGRAYSWDGAPFNFARGLVLTAVMVVVGMTVSFGTMSVLQRSMAAHDEPMRSTDFSAVPVVFSHRAGSTLMAGEHLQVQLAYKFSRPTEPVRIWVKILDPDLDGQYIGSMEALKPGEGDVVRAAYLNSAGKVKNITVVVKDANSLEIYKKDITVDYTYVDNPAIGNVVNEGKGSTITGVSFAYGAHETLKKGTFFPVTLKYDVNLDKGLYVHAMPVTKCSHTFAALAESGPVRAIGEVTMGFTIGEACHIEQVKVVLVNSVRKIVFERLIDVDLKFVD